MCDMCQQPLERTLSERNRLLQALLLRAGSREERRRLQQTFQHGDAKIKQVYRLHAQGINIRFPDLQRARVRVP